MSSSSFLQCCPVNEHLTLKPLYSTHIFLQTPFLGTWLSYMLNKETQQITQEVAGSQQERYFHTMLTWPSLLWMKPWVWEGGGKHVETMTEKQTISRWQKGQLEPIDRGSWDRAKSQNSQGVCGAGNRWGARLKHSERQRRTDTGNKY